jgi:hypothetical protein
MAVNHIEEAVAWLLSCQWQTRRAMVSQFDRAQVAGAASTTGVAMSVAAAAAANSTTSSFRFGRF